MFRIRDEFGAEHEADQPPPIAHVLTSLGEQPFRRVQEESGGSIQTSGYSGARYGEINLQLQPSEIRTVTSAAIAERWRELVGDIPGATELRFSSSILRSGADLNISLRMQDLGTLRLAADPS